MVKSCARVAMAEVKERKEDECAVAPCQFCTVLQLTLAKLGLVGLCALSSDEPEVDDSEQKTKRSN